MEPEDGKQTELLGRAEYDPYATPPLATCSYWEYQRSMGAAVRITLGAPRASLSRWTDRPSWPTVSLLKPGSEYFNRGLPPEEFRGYYLADLNRAGPAAIAAALREVLPGADGPLVLLCFEKTAQVAANPWVCHRRIFAEWWKGVAGAEVPELTA